MTVENYEINISADGVPVTIKLSPVHDRMNTVVFQGKEFSIKFNCKDPKIQKVVMETFEDAKANILNLHEKLAARNIQIVDFKWVDSIDILKEIYRLEKEKEQLVDQNLEDISFAKEARFVADPRIKAINARLDVLSKETSESNRKLLQEYVEVESRLINTQENLARIQKEMTSSRNRDVMNDSEKHLQITLVELTRRKDQLGEQIKEIEPDFFKSL